MVFFIPCLKAKRLVCLHIDFFFFQFAPAFVFVCSSLSGYKVSFSLSLTFYLLSASFAVARCLSVSVCVCVSLYGYECMRRTMVVYLVQPATSLHEYRPFILAWQRALNYYTVQFTALNCTGSETLNKGIAKAWNIKLNKESWNVGDPALKRGRANERD